MALDRLCSATVLTLLLVCAACGTGLPEAGSARPPAISIRSLPGSGWSATELDLQLQPDGSGWRAVLSSTARQPAQQLFIELESDPPLLASSLDWKAPAGALSLLVSERPGLIALGFVLPPGQGRPAGELLACRFQAASTAQSVRSLSSAPAGKFGLVEDLTASSPNFNLLLEWSYRNAGDCDQNSEVNIADLSALATRLYERSDDGEQDERDAVLDADGNGEINPADLSTIGQNYRATVGSYRLYRASGPDLETAQIELLDIGSSADFASSSDSGPGHRRFALLLDGSWLGNDKHYFVRPYDSALDSAGSASNVVSADFTAPPPLKFDIPPAGQSVPDTAACINPQLLLMPGIDQVSAAGAPVIIYLRAGGGGAGAATLMLARYSSGSWISEDISGGVNYARPLALEFAAKQRVLAYDVLQQSYVLLSFEPDWSIVGNHSSPVAAAGSGPLPLLSDADLSPEPAEIGLAHAYADGSSQVLLFTSGDGAGNWDSTALWRGNPGEVITGLSFRYDPTGAAPWCVYSAGSVDTDLANTSFLINTQLQLGRREAAGWSFSPASYPDSPLALDLGFDALGQARLAGIAARDYNLDLSLLGQGNYNLSLLFDGIAGEWNGTGFDFSSPFDSSISFGFQGFPPTGINVSLNLATSPSLAGTTGLCFGLNTGTINFDSTLSPTGGSLSPGMAFYTASGGGYSTSSLFNGEAGSSFSWKESGATLACAYLQGVALDSSNIGSIGESIAAPLLFWRN